MAEAFTLYKLIILYMLDKVDFPLTTVRKFRKSLLEFEIIGISFVQDKFRNLGVGQRKINFVQHV